MNSLKQLLSREKLWLTFIIFYSVGTGLYMLPFSREWFFYVTPFSLVLTAFAIFYYHKGWNARSIFLFVFIYISSFFTEVAGVATGKIFGTYNYGIGLGIKVLEVPLLIGLNWVVLIYASYTVISRYTSNKVFIVVGGSLLMVLYDLILEFAAPLMMMWEFKDNRPPFDNYLMWFLMSLVFHSLMVAFKINSDNKPARNLFAIQMAFFLIIVIFSLLFIR